MAMLAALSAVIRKELLFCLHIEHGLRPPEESRGDGEFVRDYCQKLGVNCRIESVPTGKIAAFARRKGTGLEAAARFFRRKALFKEAALLGENTVILIAHTKDDMLETVLMRVLRGAGPAGLAAMPANRGRILRPLLSMTRADVIAYLKEKKIPWREDSTNNDEKFLRNRIRRRLIPLLDETFPSWKSGVAAMAETQSLAADFINEEAKTRVIWDTKKIKPRGSRSYTEEDKNFISKTPCNSVSSVVKNFYDSDTTLSSLFTNAEDFFAQPEIIREEALFLGIDRLLAGKKSPVPVKRSVVRRFCAGTAAAADLGPLRVRQEGGRILLSPPRKVFSESGFSLLIKKPGLYNLKKVSVEVCASAAREEDCAFYAVLPLVFRRSFKDDFLVSEGKKAARRNFEKSLISAVDAFGTAAFIGSSGLLAARDLPIQGGHEFYFVRIKISNNEIGGMY